MMIILHLLTYKFSIQMDPHCIDSTSLVFHTLESKELRTGNKTFFSCIEVIIFPCSSSLRLVLWMVRWAVPPVQEHILSWRALLVEKFIHAAWLERGGGTAAAGCNGFPVESKAKRSNATSWPKELVPLL